MPDIPYRGSDVEIDVKENLRIAVLAVLLTAGLAHGATTATQAQTVNFTLTATVQGPATAAGSTCTTASLATQDVIGALGKAHNQTFSAKAQLLLLGNSTGGLMFYVRDVVGKTNVDTLVNDSFSMSTLGAVTQTTTSKGNATTGSEYEVGTLGVQTPSLNISLYTYGTQTLGTGALTASGFGAGSVGANQAIFKGTVTFSSIKAQ
jgi:hypothetical protein